MADFKEEQNLVIHLIEYLKKHFLVTKQEIKIDILKTAAALLFTVLLLCVSLFFLFTLTICLAFVLRFWMGSYILAFGILALFYAILALILYFYRVKLKSKIVQKIIEQIEQ
ncbi:MAG: phage holin family protein [Bacteroidia bacterium]|nr:phage holin family protein [Bacteroidia bacterium]MDW8300929.1 phage holin family protein [Bacteroidia bacterium]